MSTTWNYASKMNDIFKCDYGILSLKHQFNNFSRMYCEKFSMPSFSFSYVDLLWIIWFCIFYLVNNFCVSNII